MIENEPPSDRKSSIKGIVLMLISALEFSLVATVTKYNSNNGYPSMEILIFKGTVQLIIATILANIMINIGQCNLECLSSKLYKDLISMDKWTFLSVIGRGIFGGAGGVCYTISISMLSVGDAISLYSTFPVYTAFIAYFVLNEKLNWKHFVALILCMIGAIFITKPSYIFHNKHNNDIHTSTKEELIGGLIALLGAFLCGFVFVFIRFAHKAPTFSLIFSQGFFTVFEAIIGGLIFQKFIGLFSWKDYIGMCGIGFVSYCAQWTFNKSGQLIQANLSSIIRSTDIIWTYIWQIIFFKNNPDWITVLGAIFSIIGIMIVSYDKVNDKSDTIKKSDTNNKENKL